MVPQILDAALAYAAKGWPVFPCNPLDKRPLTKHGFKDATTDTEQIAAQWKKKPDAMIAVPMGAASGVFCVDLDRKPGGDDGVATWAKLESEYGKVLETRTHQTPSTGRHLLFKWRDGIRNISLDGLAPGIEIKGEGGYIVVPPSVMADGKAYTRNDAAIADAPSWLLAMIGEYNKREDEIEKDAAATAANKEPLDLEEVKAALAVFSSDDYFVWVKVLGALQCDVGGERGYKLFEDWSRKSKKFNQKACLRKWAKANMRQFHVATIFYFANEADPKWREQYKRQQEHNSPGSAEDGHHRYKAERALISVNDFYAYLPQHSYIYIPTRETWPAVSVNSTQKSRRCRSWTPAANPCATKTES